MADQFSERDRAQQRFHEDETGYERGRQERGFGGQRFQDDDQSAWGEAWGEPVWSYTEVWLVPGPYSGRGPSNYQRTSERIKEDVCERLTYYGQLDASDIQVEVEEGEVTLKGTVDSRRSKRMAEDITESVTGVRDIHNQLRINWNDENRPRS